jgi:hypothetical protein
MLGVLKSLPFSLMGHAVKNRVIVLINRHIYSLKARIRTWSCILTCGEEFRRWRPALPCGRAAAASP